MIKVPEDFGEWTDGYAGALNRTVSGWTEVSFEIAELKEIDGRLWGRLTLVVPKEVEELAPVRGATPST